MYKLTKTQKDNIREAQTEHIFKKAMHETHLKIDRESKTKVLKENNFRYKKERYIQEYGKIIRKPDHDYMMNDEDFENYCKFVHKERTKRGLIIPNYNTISDYKTWEALREAEDNLINICLDALPDELSKDLRKAKDNYLHKEKLLYIMLKLDVDL